MSKKSLEIFKLCEKLAELLQDKEAIADLELLFKRHPEMFKDKKEVKELIDKVVSKPEIIVDATHSNKDKGIYKAAKRLDDKKMGDIVIKKDKGLSEIFHANKKKIKEFQRLEKQVKAGSRFAHFLHPDLKSAWAGSKEHLPANENILTNSKNESQAKSREQELDGFRAKLKEVSKKIKDDEKTKNLNKDIEI